MYKNKGYAWNILRLIGEGVAMTKDLTVGSPMKMILSFTFPIFLDLGVYSAAAFGESVSADV